MRQLPPRRVRILHISRGLEQRRHVVAVHPFHQQPPAELLLLLGTPQASRPAAAPRLRLSEPPARLLLLRGRCAGVGCRRGRGIARLVARLGRQRGAARGAGLVVQRVQVRLWEVDGVPEGCVVAQPKPSCTGGNEQSAGDGWTGCAGGKVGWGVGSWGGGSRAHSLAQLVLVRRQFCSRMQPHECRRGRLGWERPGGGGWGGRCRWAALAGHCWVWGLTDQRLLRHAERLLHREDGRRVGAGQQHQRLGLLAVRVGEGLQGACRGGAEHRRGALLSGSRPRRAPSPAATGVVLAAVQLGCLPQPGTNGAFASTVPAQPQAASRAGAAPRLGAPPSRHRRASCAAAAPPPPAAQRPVGLRQRSMQATGVPSSTEVAACVRASAARWLECCIRCAAPSNGSGGWRGSRCGNVGRAGSSK